jgi:hypothetical protein
MNRKCDEDRAWMLHALEEEERVEHGLPAEPQDDVERKAPGLKKEGEAAKDKLDES